METIIETTKMTTKGQLTIPKHIREFTDSTRDTSFTVMPLDKNTIVIRKIDGKKMAEELHKLRKQVKEKLSEEEINEIIHKIH